MTKLVVRLLGGFHVELDGEAVYDFDSDKGRALLAYLVVEAGRPHRREILAGLLWPDRPDVVARKSLRQALFRLRQALSDSEQPFFLFATPTDIQFNTASNYIVDVAELEAFGRHVAAGHSQLLPEAFCGDFLAGLAVPDSEAFQAWVLNRQEHYHRLALEVLDAQNAAFEALGAFEKAIAAARLQLELEPWLEEAHRRCMRGLALAGRRDEALRQYEACCRALETELGAEPTESTRALYADIQVGRLGARETQRPDRFGKPVRSDSTPPKLVAREDELGRLARHLYAALAGETGVVFVGGDPGTGKTALLETFAELAMAEQSDLLVAGARCSPGGSLDAFAPLRKLGEMLFGDPGNPTAWRLRGPEQANRLHFATHLTLGSLEQYGPDLVGTLVPTASIARRAGRPAGPPAGRSPSQTALFDQLACTLAAIAREQPLLLLFDDLHWVDDATAAFLLHLGRELGESRVLVLGAYRSVTVALGRRYPHSGEVTRHPLTVTINELRQCKGDILVELDRADGRAFVEAYVDTEPNRLGARFRDSLYSQTGGHALFTVELLRNLQGRGELFKDEAGRWVAREPLDWGNLPARVEAAIAERIEHLPRAERHILSTASVQGDDFAAEVVAELAGMPADEVLATLSGSLARQHRLVRPEGLYRASVVLSEENQRSPHPVRSTYRFTHHLFQKYLYDELDPVERGQLHAAVAASLDRQVGDDPAERERLSAALAWHYEAGGMPLHAARALLDAGNQAIRVSAFREALSRYDHGLALLSNETSAPDNRSAERNETCRALRALLEIARLRPERHLEGIGSPSQQGNLARVVAAGAGGVPGRARLTVRLTQMERLMAVGPLEDALAAAEQLREEAAEAGQEEFVGIALLYCADIHHYIGNLQQSETCVDRLLAWLTPERRAAVSAATGTDLLPHALGFSALNRWLLGFGEQAMALSRRSLEGARAGGTTVGQAAAMALGSILLFLVRSDTAVLRELVDKCHRLCVQESLATWRVTSEVLGGRLMVTVGEEVAGMEQMRRVITECERVGLQFGADFYAVVLADSCLFLARERAPKDDLDDPAAAARQPTERIAAERRGCMEVGLAALDNRLERVRAWGGQVHESEMHRLRGELLLARDGLTAAGEALSCFERAMELGREKGALASELRAAVSLVRLRQAQGATHAAELREAQGRLAGLYGRFTEGFAFRDLQEAEILIGEASTTVR